MKVAILGPRENVLSRTTKRLREEGEKIFGKIDSIPLIDVKLRIDDKCEAFYKGKKLSEYDYILPRIDSKRIEMGYPIMKFLDLTDVKKPYRAGTILIAHNKFLTLYELVKRGIRVPETFMTGSRESASEILEREKFPTIIKLLAGFGGQAVMILESADAAKSVVETMKILKQEMLIERFIENPGEDIRAMVAGDEVIASFKRIAAPGEKKANIKLGGRGQLFHLNAEMKETALKSAEAIGARICAIDMIEGKDGIYVIEANINPGLSGIEKATDMNVAQKIMSYVHGELKK
jgi:ribosomal protein S6--L-glutamate ligase